MALATLPEQRNNLLRLLSISHDLQRNPSSRQRIKALLRAGFHHIKLQGTPEGCAESLDYLLEKGFVPPGTEGRLVQMWKDLREEALRYRKELREEGYGMSEEPSKVYTQGKLF